MSELGDYGSSVYGPAYAYLNQNAQEYVSKIYNKGSVQPQAEATPKSLFYNAATYSIGTEKTGQFLFYSVVGGDKKEFYNNYYLSENSKYNTRVSSRESKNPTAGYLVKKTSEILPESTDGAVGDFSKTVNKYFGTGNPILGREAAPYYWRDFLYCKYYGSIPNNRMITLRRFPTPMKDNLSYIESAANVPGAGRPIAQAITWFGGNTKNQLNDIIKLSSKLNFEPKEQAEILKMQSVDKGLFSVLGDALGTLGGTESDGSGIKGALDELQKGADALSTILGDGSTNQSNLNLALREKWEDNPNGPLTDYIFVDVNTVNKMWIRKRGIEYPNSSFELYFTYELTSVGEVNTKAAMFDIIGNLLSIGTNYGTFLTPEIVRNNSAANTGGSTIPRVNPSIGFPGGDDGVINMYSDPVGFMQNLIDYYTNNVDNNKNGIASKSATDKIKDQVTSIYKSFNGTNVKDVLSNLKTQAPDVLKYLFQQGFAESIKAPVSFLTGIPTGEWHIVVGNPLNPIAMIGNLICTGVEIEFSETLGPDDFPSEITAKFSMQHARDRERGEIESMFNRGGGRLYQTAVWDSGSGQSKDFRKSALESVDKIASKVKTKFPGASFSSAANYNPPAGK